MPRCDELSNLSRICAPKGLGLSTVIASFRKLLEGLTIHLLFVPTHEHVFRAEPKAQQIITDLVNDVDEFCPTNYLYLVYYMIAHIYVMNPQARVGAVGGLEMDALADLRSEGMTASSKFKTAHIYGTQFIFACDASLRYMFIICNIILFIWYLAS